MPPIDRDRRSCSALLVSWPLRHRRRRAGRTADLRPVQASRRSAAHVPLGRWRWPAIAFVAFLSSQRPPRPALALLGYGPCAGHDHDAGAMRHRRADLAEPTATTAGLSVTAAVAAIAVVLPVAYLTARYRSRVGGPVNATVVAGFALPGLVIALALVFWTLSGAAGRRRLYQTVPLLVVAYVVHFGAQAMRASQVAVGRVPRGSTTPPARSAPTAGAGCARSTCRSCCPGSLAGGGLVLLSTMKELPATLLLRPTGFDTLPPASGRPEEARWSETGWRARARRACRRSSPGPSSSGGRARLTGVTPA